MEKPYRLRLRSLEGAGERKANEVITLRLRAESEESAKLRIPDGFEVLSIEEIKES